MQWRMHTLTHSLPPIPPPPTYTHHLWTTGIKTVQKRLEIQKKKGEKKKKQKAYMEVILYYRHINWLQMEESVVLMTTLCPRPSPNQRRPAGQGPSNLVKTLAVFKVMPLMFVCMFEVTRDVSSIAENQTKRCSYCLCSVRGWWVF